jgi:formate hydrogenlyase transcriptional activator
MQTVGTRFVADVWITALKDDSGGLTGLATIMRDITEQSRAEGDLLIEFIAALVSKAGITGVVAAISAGLRKIVMHDCFELALEETGRQALHAFTLNASVGARLQHTSLPRGATPAGSAFSNRKPVLLQKLDNAYAGALDEPLLRGAKSACWLPLLNRQRGLGVLGLASRSERTFTEQHVPLLRRVADQVAVAVGNPGCY